MNKILKLHSKRNRLLTDSQSEWKRFERRLQTWAWDRPCFHGTSVQFQALTPNAETKRTGELRRSKPTLKFIREIREMGRISAKSEHHTWLAWVIKFVCEENRNLLEIFSTKSARTDVKKSRHMDAHLPNLLRPRYAPDRSAPSSAQRNNKDKTK